jgi:hypothetical protein
MNRKRCLKRAILKGVEKARRWQGEHLRNAEESLGSRSCTGTSRRQSSSFGGNMHRLHGHCLPALPGTYALLASKVQSVFRLRKG